MKTDASSIGFEALITYFVPGIVALLAVVIGHGVGLSKAQEFLEKGAEAEFLSTFLFISATAIMGAIVAAIQAVFETFFMDRLTPLLVGISRQQFEDEWLAYVRTLTNERNSYIARVVLFFQFETRLGLAFIALGACLFRLTCGHAMLALFTGIGLYLVGLLHHYELGVYRHKIFDKDSAEAASIPEPIDTQ